MKWVGKKESTMRKYSKYSSVKTWYNGILYDSKAEASWAKWLEILKLAAKKEDRVTMMERQVIYSLPGDIRCRMDFRVLYADGHSEVHEVKGFETKEWKLKLKLFREAHPDVKLRIVKCFQGKFKSTFIGETNEFRESGKQSAAGE
jgi:hypothetical protein